MPISRRTFLKSAASGLGAALESKQLAAEPLNMPSDAPGKGGEESRNSVRLPVTIAVDYSKIAHAMAGGAGASWQAIGPPGFGYKDLYNRVNRNRRGSAWGGYPPLSRT